MLGWVHARLAQDLEIHNTFSRSLLQASLLSRPSVRECADAVTQRVNKAAEENASSDYIEELRDDLRQWDAMEHAEGLDNCLQYA